MNRIILDNFPARPLYVTRRGYATPQMAEAVARAILENTPTIRIPPKDWTPTNSGNPAPAGRV